MSLKRISAFCLGPVTILPLAIIGTVLSLAIYGDPPEMHGDLERALFFQGSTDLGGGCMFAATVGLYVLFGITSSLYLVLKLSDRPPQSSWGRDFLNSLWILKYHITAFLIGGLANISMDGEVLENDFRNMFLLAVFIYTLSITLIVALHRAQLALRIQLMAAPLFTIVWIVLASDGNTPRAGQLVQSGQDPQPHVRGVRHGTMLAWHKFCDSIFGDITE